MCLTHQHFHLGHISGLAVMGPPFHVDGCQPDAVPFPNIIDLPTSVAAGFAAGTIKCYFHYFWQQMTVIIHTLLYTSIVIIFKVI